MNRRTFLAASSAAVMTGFSAGCGRAQAPSPNSKLCHACIGVGGMGHADLNSLKSHPRLQLVALCDVDKRTLEQAAAKLPGIRTYTDWRELLAEEGDRIDSVNVSTPDHMHASIALSALRARKHVYCQKPLCRDIAEIRAVTQTMGFQWTLAMGTGMWLLMFLTYARSKSRTLIIASMTLHGLAFAFFFDAAFIYVERAAPPEIRGSAQALYTTVTQGVGLFLGTQITGGVMDHFRTEGGFQWRPIFLVPCILLALCTLAFVFLFKG